MTKQLMAAWVLRVNAVLALAWLLLTMAFRLLQSRLCLFVDLGGFPAVQSSPPQVPLTSRSCGPSASAQHSSLSVRCVSPDSKLFI